MKNLILFSFLFIFAASNAQNYNPKKLEKFVSRLNENIEMIQSNRQEFNKLNQTEYDDYELEIKTFLSPFWDYDFEILQAFQIAENGDLSMKIKYFPADDEAFIYSVKGNLKDLVRSVVDIYFILEFEEDSLETTYEYMDSGKIETLNDMMIHFGVDQNNLVNSAEKAGIEADMY